MESLFKILLFAICSVILRLPNSTTCYDGWNIDTTAKTSILVNYTGTNFTLTNFPLRNSQLLNNLTIGDCKKSKCEEVRLRPKECVRAFLEFECQNCGGTFVCFKKNSKSIMFTEYENQIKSVVVNQGCNFTYYAGEFYEERKTVLPPGIHNIFDGKLASYTCNCEETVVTVSPPVETNPNHPKLLNIPSSAKDIKRLVRMFPAGRHAGLDAALTSVRNKRSPKSAYILLLGTPGSGKSSTINFLFDNPIVRDTGWPTSTASINEYRIPVQVDELGCQNCELRVIDTPGFGSNWGMETDAKFLAGLETFLSNHEELRHRQPNIILLVSKLTDNRFQGDSSNFIKVLRGIDLLGEKLLASKYSNVIVVKTHLMSETTYVRRNPEPKLGQFREIILDYTIFPRPIVTVVAENKPEENDIFMINGYYLLPNGEYYPENLFDKIQESTLRGQDPIGEAIIRTAFKSPDYFNITRTEFPLKNVTFNRELYYLAELSRTFNIALTEVSNITARVYNNDVPGHMKIIYPGSLEYIQRILNLHKIFTKEDIPRAKIRILKLFKHIRQNPLIKLLLLKAFDLKTPKLEIPLLTGQGYNVLTDVVLPVSPFKVTSYLDSDTGFKIPDILTSTITNEQVNLFNFYKTNKEYSMHRVQNQLKIEGIVKSEYLNLAPHPGFNTLERFNGPMGSKHKRIITSVREYRLFKLTLKNNVRFTAEFIDRVKKIPLFDPRNPINVEDWKNFFNKYGTHVVSSAYGGGAIQMIFKVKNDTLSSYQAKLVVKKSMEDLCKFLDDVYLGKGITMNDINTELVEYSLNFRGGDSRYFVNDFSGSTIDQTANTLDGFRTSLEFQPTMLQTAISLIPLNVLINKLDKDLALKVSNASFALLNGRLTYISSSLLSRNT